MPTLEQRIARLELSNRRLRALCLVACLGFGGLWAMGAGSPNDAPPGRTIHELLRAHRLELVNDAGQAVVRLGHSEDGGFILVFDEKSREVARIAAEAVGTTRGGLIAACRADDGGKLVSLGANKIGRGEISVFGPKDQAFVSLGAGAVGGIVSTHGDHGRELVRLGSVRGDGTVRTQNARGEVLVNLGVTAGGQGAVATYDGKGKPLVQLGATTSEGRAAISLGDRTSDRPLAQIFIDERGSAEFIALNSNGDGRGLTPQGILPVRPSTALTSLYSE